MWQHEERQQVGVWFLEVAVKCMREGFVYVCVLFIYEERNKCVMVWIKMKSIWIVFRLFMRVKQQQEDSVMEKVVVEKSRKNKGIYMVFEFENVATE